MGMIRLLGTAFGAAATVKSLRYLDKSFPHSVYRKRRARYKKRKYKRRKK